MLRSVMSSTVAALVAVLVSCTLAGAVTGAVASGLITGQHVQDSSLTGRDVRDGSIQLRDLSPRAHAALLAEAKGLRITVVTRQLDAPYDGVLAVEDIPCPPGQVVLGGGIYTGRNVVSTYDYPQFDGRSWVVGGFNHDGSDTALTARFMCAVGTAELVGP